MRLTRRMGPDYRACARGRLLRMFVWSSCLAAVLTLRPFAAAQDARTGFGEDDPRIKTSAPIFFERVDTVRVTPFGSVSDVGVRTASAGPCELQSTHTDADFDGPGDFSIVFGLAETEIFAASYTLAAEFFPIEIQSVEMVFAQTGAEDTITQLEMLIFNGTPDQGQQAGASVFRTLDFTTTEADAVNVLIDLSGNPVTVTNNGTDTFSVGFRIVEHNNQTKNPCTDNPPPNSNAFPAVDVSGVDNETDNWLFFLNCGPLGCPDGWNRFEDLAFCEPDGDWVLRATWAPQVCDFLRGACCLGDGTCTENEFDFICTEQGGRFLGENAVCPVFPDVCDGACCFDDGQCAVLTSDACEGLEGAYQTDGSDCDSDLCPAPIGACCVELDDIFCFEITDDECDLAGGTWNGAATECTDADQNDIADICETLVGACCLPSGSCEDGVTGEDCLSQGGSYEGDDSLCASSTCDGACCLDTTCLGDTEETGCPFEWYGPQTSCNDEINPCLVDPADGACCPSGGGPCQVLPQASCEMEGDTWFGPGSICTPGQCDEPPDPVGACCSVGGQPCACLEGLTELECAGAPGIWAGPNSSCTDCEPCEACCDPCIQTCVDELPSVCTDFGNVPQGEGSNCATTACDVPVGACCGPEPDVCFDRTESNCNLLGGIWQGCEILCDHDQVDCAAIGACCLPNETCVEVQVMACESNLGGVYQGNGTVCVPGLCEQAECETNADCNDGNPCTIDSCSPDNLCAHAPVDCNDNDACTDDSCNELGECVHDLIDCDDGDDCTEDSCDPGSGCAHAPIVPCCGNGEVEKGEGCDPPDGETCDDNCQLIPTGACCQGETCGEGQTADQCAAGGGDYQGDETTCDPDPCVQACCATAGGCFELPPGDCIDGIGGTPQGPGSTCATSECCADDTECDDGDACNGVETCLDNACQEGTPLDCDDLTVCTDDSCDPANGCVNDPIDCDDGDVCTVDTCDPATGCAHEDVDCTGAGDQCNTASCNPAGAEGNCDILTQEPDDTPCDDQDGCTENDICTAGVCGGTVVACGACCFTNGNCEDGVSEDACTAAGGTWQGDGVICTPDLCPGCTRNPGAAENDCCTDAIPISTGLTDYDTTNANTDGPIHTACDFDGQTYHDIWYQYTADCSADTIVSTCEDLGAGADYDTDVVVYDGCDCDGLVLLGCNDDDEDHPCGAEPIYQSTVTVSMVAGNCYMVRVGGWFDDDQGIGTLLIDPQCGACCQGDTCLENLGSSECTDIGGDYQGKDTACADIDCTITGACCMAGGDCAEMTPQACAEQSGGYQGDETLCDPDPCGCGDCPTDVDGDGQTGPFDLAVLLGNWGPVGPDAECLDANFDGSIGPFDLAFLLGNWGPCQ